MFSLTNLTEKERSLQVLLVIEEKWCDELLHYLPVNREAIFKQQCDKLLNLSQDERKRFLSEELQYLQNQKKLFKIEEIHPTWLAKNLQKERPFIISFILKHLPPNKRNDILAIFSEKLKENLSLSPLKSVNISSEMSKIIRKKFENRFISMKNLGGKVSKIVLLKEENFLKFIREIGLREVARAIKGINENDWTQLYYSLHRKEREELSIKMRELTQIDNEEIKFSQERFGTWITYVKKTFHQIEDLFKEVGLLILSALLLGENKQVITQICQKLPIEDAEKIYLYLKEPKFTLAQQEKDKLYKLIESVIEE
ncbi:MAG: hypothetical protein AB1414_00315 [bacterium]